MLRGDSELGGSNEGEAVETRNVSDGDMADRVEEAVVAKEDEARAESNGGRRASNHMGEGCCGEGSAEDHHEGAGAGMEADSVDMEDDNAGDTGSGEDTGCKAEDNREWDGAEMEADYEGETGSGEDTPARARDEA